MIGINTNCECGKDYKEILSNIKNTGFKSVMVAFKTGQAEETLKEALRLGLNVPYVHLTNTNNLWCKGPENEIVVQSLKEQISLCAKYGIPIAVMHATRGSANELALPPNEHGLKCIKELVDFAKKHKVKIALENLDKLSYKHFVYVMENIKDKNLGFCYDCGHHQLYLPKVDLLKRYGNRILAVHLHDNNLDWEYGFDWSNDLHFLPFDGKINYNKVCEKLAKTPYKNVIMLEVHKDCWGMPTSYDKLTNEQYLKEAHKRAEKLENLLEKYRKQ